MRIQQYVKKSLLFAIGTSYEGIWRDFNLKLRKENCNFLQAVTLIALMFEEDRDTLVTPSLLSQSFGTSRGSVSQSLSALQKRGWIKRSLTADDARSYQIALKPEGRRAALRLMKEIDRVEGFFESRFSRQEVLNTIQSIAQFEKAYRESSA